MVHLVKLGETAKIAHLIRIAFNGDPWFGHSIQKILGDVDAAGALAHPIPGSHSIWELVLHIDLWATIAIEATAGTPMPRLWGTEKDWLTPAGAADADWQQALDHLFATAEKLAQATESFDGERLGETVPGRDYDFSHLLHGVPQHCIYHAGQIAQLKSALRK